VADEQKPQEPPEQPDETESEPQGDVVGWFEDLIERVFKKQPPQE
jgi:hypothetical protein